MNFIFSCSTRHLTSERSERVRYRVEHSKIKFISTCSHVISSIYPTRANGIIVLVNSQPGFASDFYFHNFTKRKLLHLAHYFPYDVKLRLLAHSRSFLANQKARNAIVGAIISMFLINDRIR